MAGGDDELGRIVGIGRAERALVARDAGIDFAVGRIHRERFDRPVRHVVLHFHFRRGLVRRADDEVAIDIGRRHFAIGQLFGGHVARRVRIARRRSWPRRAVSPTAAFARRSAPRGMDTGHQSNQNKSAQQFRVHKTS